MATVDGMLSAFLSFSSIAALTWFLSSRPRLYLLVFVPRDEWLGVARWAFRQEFCRGMRLMAGLQLGMAFVVGLLELWLQA
jgi:hypothetical protein